MDRTLKIFVACALGAGIGALVALQLNQYLWWLGMIVGGIIGYLSYDFKAVINTIPRAYKAAKGWGPKKENVSATVHSVLWTLWVVLLLIPIVLLMFVWCIRMFVWCIRKIPDFLRLIGQFLRQLFILIHSEVRLLCGVDAAIGATVGYFTGNAITGTVIGGILGVINYRVVSQKILKLRARPKS